MRFCSLLVNKYRFSSRSFNNLHKDVCCSLPTYLPRRCFCNLPKDVSGPLPSGYIPVDVEKDWYQWWEKNHYFEPESSGSFRKKFSLVLPPPNVTGTLHLGHALTCAIQDSLARWNRMNGKNVIWFPGCDHAGIATQVVVEKKLKAAGESRLDVGREEFLNRVWQWKGEKEWTIYQQMRTMGSTLSWDHATFTMDPKMCYAVNEAFIRLHNAGLIYRKESLVNWSCQLQSAISDIEVEHRNVDKPTSISVPGHKDPVQFGLMYQFAYKLSDSNDQIVVSTTRPETMLGDTAVAVHPEDHRYGKFIGKAVFHPLRHEDIPVIADTKVDPLLGTGALKITPAHDVDDFEIAARHGLRMVNIFDNRGIANENCGNFQGLARFDLRREVLDYLKDANLLKGSVPHAMSMPFCSRSGDVIEPLLRPQWFLNMRHMADRAVEAVRRNQLRIHPAHFENVWFDWLVNIRDWCISRQLWWGHRIPAFCYKSEAGQVVWTAAHSKEEAASRLGIDASHEIRQEDDVLDTWFSSALFPFVVCGWPDNTENMKRLFPLDIMETGHDILFFWVARMVMMSLQLTDQLPFKDVLLHGIICDSQGRKMSKSLGNVIDPMDVIHGVSLRDLEKQLQEGHRNGYLSREELARAVQEKRSAFAEGIPQIGADALRFTLCSYNVKNHFINLDLATMKRNRLFCNKIWQATRFLFLKLERCNGLDRSTITLPLASRWILSRLHRTVDRVNAAFASYDFHHATDALHHFLHAELCDVYLEAMKPLTGCDSQKATSVLAECLDISLRALAPFMPYLAEELYQRLHWKLDFHKVPLPRAESVLVASYPQEKEFVEWRDPGLERSFGLVLQAVAELRAIKLQYGLAKMKPKALFSCSMDDIRICSEEYSALIVTLAGVQSVGFNTDLLDGKKSQWVSRTVSDCSVHLNLAGVLDARLELRKSQDKLAKLRTSLIKLEATANSTSFKANAPPHVQQSHLKKMQVLRDEVQQLVEYSQMIEKVIVE